MFVVVMRRGKGAVVEGDDDFDNEGEPVVEDDDGQDLVDEDGDFSEEVLVVDDEKRRGLYASDAVFDAQPVEFLAPGDDD